MIFNKNISLGISLFLSLDDYKFIFENYHNNIKEIYFTTPSKEKYIQSRSIIFDQYQDYKNIEKIISILHLAKEYDIKIELAVNSIFEIKERDIKEMYEWCAQNNIQVDKIVTLNNLVDTCYKYFGNIEYCYSYNNNIINHEFLNNINKLFSEVVIGNRSLRDVKLFKKIHDKGLKIKLLLDNGCQHNCYWCSSKHAGSCEYVANKNAEKYSINFLMAIQSVFPFEVKQYYNKLNIESYKLSTRVCKKDEFINTIEYYINNKEIKSIEEFFYSSKLTSLLKNIDKKQSEVDFYKIKKIKEKIWEEIINGKNINSCI